MRPVRLVMHAFGPYRGKVDLDFTNFGASSIYLISGPTGSGKTTIFDGISYALYNKASSTARDPDMLKSQFATDEDLCYVELTFEMGQTEYRVKRIPKQRAPGARGTPINQPREVEFYKENQLLDTGMDADAAIETLLGLTYDQFRQIVLLPQGEFRKLLLSSSRDKEAIFRNIFGTEAIQDFQDRLRDKAKALNKEYEEYGTRLDQSLQNIEGIEDETLATAIDQTDYEKVLDILAETIEKENKELTQNKQEIEKLNQVERQRETLIGLLEEQAALEKQKEELEELKEEIKVHQKSLRLDAQAKEVNVEADKTKDLEKEAKALNEQLEENKVSLVEVKKELEVLLEE
ncbi:MAG TPA: AAA family ATPase, partial [Atopostipes sp.]|nr:AAA family ATPase [Atopostipes sp.]